MGCFNNLINNNLLQLCDELCNKFVIYNVINFSSNFKIYQSDCYKIIQRETSLFKKEIMVNVFVTNPQIPNFDVLIV